MEFGTAKRGASAGSGAAGRRSGAGGASALTHRGRRARLRVGDGTKTLGGRHDDELEAAFPCVASFYESVPEGDVGLADFESLAVERLKVLRAVEKVGQLGAVKYSKEWVQKMDEELGNVKGDLRAYSYAGMSGRGRDHLLARERDHFSHYILRLAYCHQEEKRRWMVQQEYDLFRYRCQRMVDLRELIEVYDLNYIPVPDEEVAAIRQDLEGLAYNKTKTFYKVHFTEALDLVRSRKVVMADGFCYVPDTEMVTLVCWIFKSMLTQALLFTNKMLPGLNEDERMGAVLKDLDTRYTGADYSAKEGDGGPAVTPDMIRPLSQKHFPLCMRSMQNALNATHHLKYKARLQYGLFLKGIGLSMEDSIRFFRQEFTQAHIDGDKFDKEYVYGIRYNYGREGRKTNWAPWDCMRVIMGSVGPGENHGCPYRHNDPDSLRAMLVASGVEGADLNDIMQLAKDGHYQKACSSEYRALHKGLEISTGMVNHPNQYYTESINGGAPGGGSGAKGSNSKVKTERANVYAKDEDDDFMMEAAAMAESDEPKTT